MEQYDLIVLGGGPAGYNAAGKAGAAGLKTLLIEKNALGGVCLNEGCIPSKTLLNSAKLFDHARKSEEYGVTAKDVKIDQKKVVARKRRVVRTLITGVSAAMKRSGVTVKNACGEILGRGENGFAVQAGDETFSGRNLLICTGSSAVVPPIPGLREGVAAGYVTTNHEIFDLEKIPENLVVIGGGVVGLEMASYFNSAGSRVTVIEMLDHIAGETDRDISGILMDVYRKKGVAFKLGCKVTGVEKGRVFYENGGKPEEVPADIVLCCVGRRAVTTGFGLETLGVVLERGAIKTDEYMKTNIAGLYAAGDVNGKSMLAHTAYREGEVAVNNILGRRDRMRYSAIPSVIYTDPEIAAVGETEASARRKGYDVSAVSTSMRVSGRYVAENEGGNGIFKLIVDNRYRRVLGAHMIGGCPSESIYGVALMIETEMRVDDLKELVFPHPTACEAIREALFEVQ